jgi:phenylalanyl-tRNA synthetase alpha chain
MNEDLQNLKNEAMAQIMDAKTLNELTEIEKAYLGRNGKLNNITKKIKDIPTNERKDTGRLINEIKSTINLAVREKGQSFKIEKRDWFDPTIPVKVKVGHYHPTTLVIKELYSIFKHMGFSFVEGPEIETEEFNFEKLNLPRDHPARSLQDALYAEDPDVVLRTHTSSVEARVLAQHKSPFRVVVAGKCYRYENVNASNNVMFYQFQGVALQKGLSMADLKGTLFYFAREFFGKDREVRFRCKYYPEVEPGGGLDLNCPFCNKKGCAVCKGRGWLEMLGCGMIHPNILRVFGYDPKEISGFAFGMGLDRLVMDKYGIDDIRSLYNGDISYT